MNRFRTVLLVLACVFFQAAPAFAETPEETAKTHFEAGAEHYFNQEYGKAIVEFMKGNAIMPNALFLYNISLSHVKLGNTQEALDHAIQAREMGGLDEQTATQNEGRIVALRRAAFAQTFEPPVVAVEEPMPIESESGFGTLGWVGVGTTVVGAGLLVGAGVIELGLQDTWDEYEAAAAANDTERYNTLKTEIEDDQTTGLILLAAGAGVSLVGVTLIAVELLSGESNSGGSALFVQPTDQGGIVGISGAF